MLSLVFGGCTAEPGRSAQQSKRSALLFGLGGRRGNSELCSRELGSKRLIALSAKPVFDEYYLKI
jgi:hypothetical protein